MGIAGTIKKRVKFFTREEEADLARRAKAGDAGAKHALVESILPMAIKLASKKLRAGFEREDLEQVAAIGVIKAVDKFDPDLGFRLTTYAHNSILNFLRTELWTNASVVRLPSSYKSHEHRARATSVKVLSLDFAQDDEGHTMADVIPDRSAWDAAEAIDKSDELEQLHASIAKLPERLATIMRMRLEECTLAQVGEHVGLTRERVRQLEAKALAILKARATGRRRWTKDELEFLKANRHRGWVWCAEQLGRTPQVVRSKVAKIGLQNTYREITDFDELRRLHAQGLVCREIGERLGGFRDETVRRHLHLLGLSLNPRDEKRQAAIKIAEVRGRGFDSLSAEREAKYRRRVESLGFPASMPYTAALVLAALRDAKRRMNRNEVADATKALCKANGWHAQGTWQTVLKWCRWAAEHGLVTVHGRGNRLRYFEFIRPPPGIAE